MGWKNLIDKKEKHPGVITSLWEKKLEGSRNLYKCHAIMKGITYKTAFEQLDDLENVDASQVKVSKVIERTKDGVPTILY